jgi:hypothetical protein
VEKAQAARGGGSPAALTGLGPVAGVELLHAHKSGQRARNLNRRRLPDDGVIGLITGQSPRASCPAAHRGEREHSRPRRPEPALPACPFFPYLLHDLIGNIPRGLRPRDRRRPFVQGWRENATGNQSLLVLRAAFQTAGNDPRHGLIAVADKHLFAVANQLNMGAELRSQIADIDSSHAPI